MTRFNIIMQIKADEKSPTIYNSVNIMRQNYDMIIFSYVVDGKPYVDTAFRQDIAQIKRVAK
jgi:hypothetical protein